ncbi:MAG: hypothetical protein ACK41O_27000, partial [Runella zeae]
MQCADIFFLKVLSLSLSLSLFMSSHSLMHALLFQADICQLGMDQRKVNVLAREYCDSIKRKLKPIILSHRCVASFLLSPIPSSHHSLSPP